MINLTTNIYILIINSSFEGVSARVDALPNLSSLKNLKSM